MVCFARRGRAHDEWLGALARGHGLNAYIGTRARMLRSDDAEYWCLRRRSPSRDESLSCCGIVWGSSGVWR